MPTRRATKRAQVQEHLEKVWSRPKEDAFPDLIAIDPGDRWTGVAFFKESEDGWECIDAQEFEPPQSFEDALAGLLMLDRSDGQPTTVVYEKWRLYADHAQEKTGSEFETSQHIGVIKYLVRIHNEHVQRHDAAEDQGKMMLCEQQGGQCADPNDRPKFINLVKQPADIKKPTRGILNKKKIKSIARPIAREYFNNRDHVVDAELHGWKYILDTLKGKAAP